MSMQEFSKQSYKIFWKSEKKKKKIFCSVCTIVPRDTSCKCKEEEYEQSPEKEDDLCLKKIE
jgi:hypothetical protein